MLQIASGKLFSGPAAQRNELRGVLYTNLMLYATSPIETAAGRLLSTESMSQPNTVVYEMTELIEDEPEAGAVVSHGAEPYLSDFGVVVSFALNVICTPDQEAFRRLMVGLGGPLATAAPRDLVSQVFDDQIWCTDERAEELVEFTEALIGLKRKDFLASMRSMRTYVTALHRLGDDPELTYMLLVASIESLAADFDGGAPNWDEYPEETRLKVDRALEGADGDLAERVRGALLEVEHKSLGRRYRSFVFEHLTPSYFREDARERPNPAARADLPEALKRSYDLRSRYVHRLSELPDLLSMRFVRGETVPIDGEEMLTFEGLARLARHTIKEHIERQPKVAKEAYDYRSERAGIVELPTAPKYWIWKTENFETIPMRRRLEGFLSQLAAVISKEAEAELTDLRAVLAEIEKTLPTMDAMSKRAALVLHRVFSRLALGIDAAAEEPANVRQFADLLEGPSVETMVQHLLLGTVPEWALEDHQVVHDDFLRDQGKRKCLKLPRLFRSYLSLALAERCRQAGDAERACNLITVAVENDPGRAEIHQLETDFDPDAPIPWNVHLLAAEDSTDSN